MGRRRTEEEWESHKFTKEADLQNYIMKRVKEYRKANNGTALYAWKAADRNTAGVSDLILCVCGRFLAIELKVGSNKPTDLQVNFLQDIIKAGGDAGVAYTWGSFKVQVNDILRAYHLPLL